MSLPLDRLASRVALISIFSNSLLTALKVGAAWSTGSVSILSEAVHSSMDLLASFIAFVAVRISRVPADRDHPWGHGKAENLSGVAEGILIFVAAGLIISEAIQKIIQPHPMTQPLLGMAIMAISAMVNTVVAFVLYRTAKKTGSLALEADALHLKTDVYTSVGVAGGLGLVAWTGWPFLDPIVALLVALLIVKESWNLVRRSFSPLMDGALDPHDLELVEGILAKFMGPDVSYHDLRARRSGHQIFAEFHLTMSGRTSLAKVHDLTDRIEAALAEASIIASIHMEPTGRP